MKKYFVRVEHDKKLYNLIAGFGNECKGDPLTLDEITEIICNHLNLIFWSTHIISMNKIDFEVEVDLVIYNHD